jgi:hypothetical protein
MIRQIAIALRQLVASTSSSKAARMTGCESDPRQRGQPALPARVFAAISLLAIIASALTGGANAAKPRAMASPADPPSYVTWYYATPTPTPSPITGAYAAIGGALGAGNLYNTATNGFGTNGTAILNTGQCYFICYGSPGTVSKNVLAIGTDLSTQSFMTLGAPDDCHGPVPPFETPPPCPGGVTDNLFALESYPAPSATPTVLIAIDANANFGVFNNIYAGAAVVAGAGVGTPNPVPSPTTGSLVSYTGNGAGTGAGDILLGSATSYVKCDYGETTASDLTCNSPVRSAVSASSSPGPVPPCYEHNGSSCADTFHIVKNASALRHD